MVHDRNTWSCDEQTDCENFEVVLNDATAVANGNAKVSLYLPKKAHNFFRFDPTSRFSFSCIFQYFKSNIIGQLISYL